ncbi:snoRNA binding domain protein [Trichuris suis]|nr:snoRNA binding domain protein [Trichuris suis]
MFILFEHASGYSLFNVKQFEELGAQLESVEASVRDFGKFNALVHLHAYAPFENVEDALEECLAITDGLLPPLLLSFLEKNLLGTNKKSVTLGVGDPKLGQAISSQFPTVKCLHTDAVPEVLRGIRYHFTKYCKKISGKAEFSAQLGLGHRLARAKVQFNANRVDNMIMQAIALVDQTGKDINTFVMRIREWYSYHFPELYKLVPDQYLYCQCASYIGERSTFTEDKIAHLAEILSDEEKAKEIFEASRNSIGMEVTAVDLLNVNVFCARVISLMEYRTNMLSYLKNRMQSCAPSLSAVVGEQVGARLISQAGSLNNLAKYPASTIQILGAEKALFRALKKKGLIELLRVIMVVLPFCQEIRRNKGKISRFLANKCAIASRIDCFAEIPLSIYGEHLKAQIEERLRLFETGIRPKKNVDVMREAIAEAKEQEASMLQKLKVKTRKSHDFKENEASAVEVVGADSEDANFSKDSLHTNMNGLKKKRKLKEKLRDESGGEDINTSPSIMESGRKRKKRKSNIDA